MALEPEPTEPSAREGRAAPAASGRGRGRRLVRILAFQTLYEMDVSHHRPGEVLQRLLDEQQPAPETGAFARELVTGVLRNRAAIDEQIHTSAPAYPLAQMSPI